MNKKYNVNEDFFKEWSEEMAYVLGFWFADGCIGRWGGGYRFTITSNDLEILKEIRCAMKSNHKLKTRKDDKSYTLVISCKEIYNDIIKLGGCERKSLVAEFPDVPKEYMRHFIRGYFDGDGSIKSKRLEPQISFVGTKQFLDSLEMYLPYKGRLIKESMNTYSLSYSSEYAMEVLCRMYDNSNIYLERKYSRYKKFMKWKRQRKLRSDSVLCQLNGYPVSYSYGK